MNLWVEIEAYRDFWDVPRILFFKFKGNWWLMDAPFLEEKDDFADWYGVFKVPSSFIDIPDWRQFPEPQKRYVGKVLVSQVRFDQSNRKKIEISWLLGMIGNV